MRAQVQAVFTYFSGAVKRPGDTLQVNDEYDLKEKVMNIVYAAESPSIAKLLSDHTKRSVNPADIKLTENPDETGSFCIGWRFERFVLSPDGVIEADELAVLA